MTPIETVTVCITTYKRPRFLERALQSCLAAGVKRIVVCGCYTTPAVVIPQNVELREAPLPESVGCNETWMVAAYHATTKRIVILHDDDELHPDFGQVYQEVIGPALDERKAGFVSWKPELKHEDGTTEPCTYWPGPSTLMPSFHLLKVVNNREGFSLSPVVSVLNRAVVIRACKEAGEELVANPCYERPGMLYGTEIVVYLRHIQAFKRWLYLDRVLSYYGSHAGSGTIRAQKKGEHGKLIEGYNVARDYGNRPPKDPTPRILFCHSTYTPKDEAIRRKQELAHRSWQWHFANGEFIDFPNRWPQMPTINAVLDWICQYALPEDIVMFSNEDAGLTTHAYERIVAGVARGQGVSCLPNRSLSPVDPCLYKEIRNGPASGGIEMVALRVSWWTAHRFQMPEMYIGREAWDAVFAKLAEDWADGPTQYALLHPDERLASKAHTDNVCWHEPHFSEWQDRRLSCPLNLHNRDKAREFFRQRGCSNMLALLK